MGNELPKTVQDKFNKLFTKERYHNGQRIDIEKFVYEIISAERKQAQAMADVLEWIRVYGNVGELTIKFIDKAMQQFKDGKEVENQAEAKEGIIRVILAGAYEVSKDAASAEEYLKSEGVDVAQLKANAQYFTWKAELIRITKEKTGESVVKINDEEAVKWYNDGFTPEQTFRETWQSDGD